MQIKRFFLEGLELVSVRNHDNFVVTFSPLGASITSIELDDNFMTLTPYDVETFKNKMIFHGKTIGRVANRIKNGTIKVKGKTYTLQKNNGKHTLHGGVEGLSNQFFDLNVVSNDKETKVIFTYLSPHLEGGFPGNLDIKVVYTIFEDRNSVTIDYSANTDKETLIGFTNHSYFSLGSKTLDDLSLYINANRFIHPDRDYLIPTEYRPVDSVMDFQVMKKITKDIEANYLDDSWTYGYDHHYCFNDNDASKYQVVLENDKYKMGIATNFNGTQIYTDNYPDDVKFEGTTAIRRRAVAIEPQDDLLARVVLKPKETYTRFIRYDFYRK